MKRPGKEKNPEEHAESDPLKKRDLRRFRQYEAVTGYTYQKDVVTYVVCTADAKVMVSRLETGINTYRVRIIRINRRSADSLYKRLDKTPPEEIRKEDLLAAVFSLLMKGRLPAKERVKKGFCYLDRETPNVSREERKKMQAMLYMLATKFLKKDELAEIKEECSMTILGQMLMEDGMQKGEDLFANLADRLLADGRSDEVRLAAKDLTVRRKLYREYGLAAK